MKTKSYFLSLVLIFLIVNLPIFACKQAWDLPPDTVHTVAKIANRAYDDTHYSSGGAIVHAIRETFVGHEWDKYLFSGSTGHYMFEGGIRHTFGAVSYAPDFGTVVSIHGSWFLYDWITNFDFSLVSASDHGYERLPGKVHRGFVHAASSYFDAMSGLMNRVFEENPAARTQDIYFTGHSLAGALAKLTALRYSITSGSAVPNQIKVIAFSPPNIGDKDFIEHVEEYRLSKANVLNFYSESDIVPRVPPSLLGYKRGIGHYIPIHALEISEHRIAALVSRLTGDSHISKVGAIIEANEIRRNKLSILAWSHGLYDELILKEFRNFQVQIRSNGSAGAAPLFSVRRPILKFLGWLVN